MRLFGLSSLRALWRDRRANALVLTGFALPFVIGAAGIGVHSIDLTLKKRQMQREADSAALSGAYSLFQGQSNSIATAAANQALTQNALVKNVTATITPGSFTSAGTLYPQTVYVNLVHSEPTPFMSLFGKRNASLHVTARAAVVPQGDVCALALITGNAVGVNVQGSATIDLGCGIGSNGTGQSVTSTGGHATMIANPVISGGTIDAGAFATGTVLMENHAPIPDPFANTVLTPPSSDVTVGKCNTNISVASNGTGAGVPGCYGTISVGSGGTLNLSPGTYYLTNTSNGGGLQVGANARLNCTGCAFVLTSTSNNITGTTALANMAMDGTAVVNISAPLSGQYAGILIYRDKRGAAATSGKCCTLTGNSGGTLSGAIYTPKDNITFTGSSGFMTHCLFLVGRTLSFQGNGAIQNTCVPPGGAAAWSLSNVRLIT